MARELSRFQHRLLASQQRRGTAFVVVAVTAISCIISVAICYAVIAAVYGPDGLLRDAEPVELWLPLAVPAIVAPIVTFQFATALRTAAALIEELSNARNELQVEVAARKETQIELEALAHRDVLTGLLNRRGFFDAWESLESERRGVARVVMVDVDEFKSVNDTYGHAAGDAVLCAIADRLIAIATESALVARLGGDEFVVMMFDDGGSGSDRIRREIAEIVVDISPEGDATPAAGILTEGSLRVFCSVGVSQPADNARLDAVLAEADTEMYGVKKLRRRSPNV